MALYNFFVNVDNCLSMANFDMFFYKLQSEEAIQCLNLDTGDPNSFKKVLSDIKGIIEESAVLIQNYRIVFALRLDDEAQKIDFTKSVLYRLLQIKQAVSEIEFDLQFGDRLDRSISLLVLRQVKNHQEADAKATYALSDDIEQMLEEIGIREKVASPFYGFTKNFEAYIRHADYENRIRACADRIEDLWSLAGMFLEEDDQVLKNFKEAENTIRNNIKSSSGEKIQNIFWEELARVENALHEFNPDQRIQEVLQYFWDEMDKLLPETENQSYEDIRSEEIDVVNKMMEVILNYLEAVCRELSKFEYDRKLLNEIMDTCTEVRLFSGSGRLYIVASEFKDAIHDMMGRFKESSINSHMNVILHNELLADMVGYDSEDKSDPVLVQCLNRYMASGYSNTEQYADLLDEDEKSRIDPASEMFINEFRKRYKNRSSMKNRTAFINAVLRLQSFLNDETGSYCVLTKCVIAQNAVSSHLGYLSVVEFLNEDPYSLQFDETVTLKKRCEELWKLVSGDDKLYITYSTMLDRYYKNLSKSIYGMERRERGGRKELNLKEEEYLSEPISVGEEDTSWMEEIFRDFSHSSSVRVALHTMDDKWEKTWKAIESRCEDLEHDIEKNIQQVTMEYNIKIMDRRKKQEEEESLKADDLEYSPVSIDHNLRRLGEKRRECMNLIKAPETRTRMSFQDRINRESELRRCKIEIDNYMQMLKKISIEHFLSFLIVTMGIIGTQYVALQYYAALEGSTLLWMCVCFLGMTIAGSLVSYATFAGHYSEKVNEGMLKLQEQLKQYIDERKKQLKEFVEYTNNLNRLDEISSQVRRLEKIHKISLEHSKKENYHITEMRKHQNRCLYFDNLFSLDSSERIYADADDYIRVNTETDVIHNRLYWPQNREGTNG